MNRKDPRLALGIVVGVFFIALALSLLTLQVYGGPCGGSACISLSGVQPSNGIVTLHYVVVYNNGTAVVYGAQQTVIYQCHSGIAASVLYSNGQTIVVETPAQSCVATEYDG